PAGTPRNGCWAEAWPVRAASAMLSSPPKHDLQELAMPVLTDLIDALRSGRVQVVDLTAPLHSGTPILQLPPPFANASPFGLTEISRYDERGPAWYWNDIHTSEPTGNP